MKSFKITQAHADYFAKTLTIIISDYDALIADPETQAERWENYGTFSGCRMCVATIVVAGNENPYHDSGTTNHRCDVCPMNADGLNCRHAGCSSDAGDTDMTSSNLDVALSKYNHGDYVDNDNYTDDELLDNIRDAATARRSWIIKTIRKNGYIYK